MPDGNSGNFIRNSGIIVGNISQSQGAGGFEKTPLRSSGQAEGTADAFTYDLAVSYAGEQERTVSRVSKILKEDGFRVFFAPEREAEYLAEDMITRFYRIYRYESRYVAAFVTEEYLRKDITMHEAATAMLRRREEGRNCLIPIYFGQAVLPRLDPDINYIRGDGLREVELADKIKSILQAASR